MHYIYFGQYQGISATSYAIRKRTNSPISHTAIFLPDLETVIEAVSPKVVKRNWKEGHTPTTKILIYKIKCTLMQQDLFYSFAEEQIGKGYDFNGVAGFILPVTQNKDKWFCSELFMACSFEALFNSLDIKPHEASPRDVQLIPDKEMVEMRIVPGELPKNIVPWETDLNPFKV